MVPGYVKRPAGIAQVCPQTQAAVERFDCADTQTLADGSLFRLFRYVVRPVRTAVKQPVFRRGIHQHRARQRHMAVVSGGGAVFLITLPHIARVQRQPPVFAQALGEIGIEAADEIVSAAA